MSKPNVKPNAPGAISDVDPKDVVSLIETVIKIIKDLLKPKSDK